MMRIPASMLLCYEKRSNWIANNPGPSSSERARWLAPDAEINLAAHLVRSAGIAPIMVPLEGSRKDILAEMRDLNDVMLWNVSDGLESFLGSLIPAYGRLADIPWLGSSVYCQGLCQQKHHWRAVLSAHHLYCLPAIIIRSLEDTIAITDADVVAPQPPLFVKTTSYGNNAGFSIEDPMASTLEIALEKARHLVEVGMGPILIEEYAPGVEYSVWAFHLDSWIQQSFVKSIDAPYLLTELKDRQPTTVAYELREHENPHITTLTNTIVNLLGISDYVRMEFRQSRSGKMAPLDINTGAFFIGRAFELAAKRTAGSAENLFNRLVEASYTRQVSRSKKQV